MDLLLFDPDWKIFISNILEQMNIENLIHLKDLGEVAFLHIKGFNHSQFQVNNANEVIFVFTRDVEQLLHEYWNNQASVNPLRFKMEIDQLKRLVFNVLNNKYTKYRPW